MPPAPVQQPAQAPRVQDQQPQQPQQQRHQPQQQQQPPNQEDKWAVNRPVERRCEALTEELSDCLGRFWGWVTCGGPSARLRQLYVTGKLARCADEYVRFKNCLVGKLNPDAQIELLPGPHPLWHIRTRKQAAAFWRDHYAHLGAGGASGARSGQPQQAGELRADVSSKPT